MEPEDVVLEAITAAAKHGDSVYLRSLMCRKLQETLKKAGYIKAIREVNEETG